MRRGSFARGRYITAKVLPTPAGGTIRAAAVVSKKVARNSVERNRVRRALYNAVSSLSVHRPLNIVFIVNAMPTEQPERAFTVDVSNIVSTIK